MASILKVENINEMDELDLEFNKVTFDDNVDLQEYEILSVGNNDDNNNNIATKNIEEEYILIEGNINDDPVNVSSDSEDEGPLIAPRNAASGDDRAHTPNKHGEEHHHWRGHQPCTIINNYNQLRVMINRDKGEGKN